MITDHVWRPPHAGIRRSRIDRLDRPCEYLNCRRPLAEHARAASPGSGR